MERGLSLLVVLGEDAVDLDGRSSGQGIVERQLRRDLLLERLLHRRKNLVLEFAVDLVEQVADRRQRGIHVIDHAVYGRAGGRQCGHEVFLGPGQRLPDGGFQSALGFGDRLAGEVLQLRDRGLGKRWERDAELGGRALDGLGNVAVDQRRAVVERAADLSEQPGRQRVGRHAVCSERALSVGDQRSLQALVADHRLDLVGQGGEGVLLEPRARAQERLDRVERCLPFGRRGRDQVSEGFHKRREVGVQADASAGVRRHGPVAAQLHLYAKAGWRCALVQRQAVLA